MNTKRHQSAADLPEAFREMYCQELDCCCIEIGQAIPRFQIEKKAILYAVMRQPQRNDLVIFQAGTCKNRFFIGRLIKRKGIRVVLEMPDGLTSLVLSNTLLVIIRMG